jgi:putative ATP-dependent endonuclease of the OLD family
MRLCSISVSRYRSILDATRIELGDFTVLVGKNNTGKSNFLRGLQIAFQALQQEAVRSSVAVGRRPLRSYEWERDFPLSLRDRDAGRRDTTFRLSFDLSLDERARFSPNLA